MRFIALFVPLLCIPAAGSADESLIRLRPGPELDKVETQCSICHSLDYIVMNSPFLTAQQWDKVIAKMINAFGAPIDPGDAKAIGDYLKRNYGGS
jgi:hypothetical protein